MKNKTRHLSLEIKSFEEDGVFTGYGSVFGIKDSYGDVVVKGAFQNSLIGKMPMLLWQHRSDMPIGIFTRAEEDAKGLHLKGKLALDTTMGKDAYALLKMGAIKGLSIGYFLNKYDINKEEKTLYIQEADLLEVSLVTFPANQESQVEQVKSDFFGKDINKDIADLKSRMTAMEANHESMDDRVSAMECGGTMKSEGSDEVVVKSRAEAKTHENGADDGAEKEALDALAKLLATFR